MSRAPVVSSVFALAASVAVISIAVAPACTPELGPPESLVTGRRILAVRGEPAEAAPGEAVAYRALLVDASGPVDRAALAWGFCATPRPLTENNAVARACLESVRPIGDPANAVTPLDACRLFGPDPPPGGFARAIRTRPAASPSRQA